MKILYTLFCTLFCFTVQSQNLVYDQGFKFDVESGFYYNDDMLEDLLFINHSDSLLDYNMTWQPDSAMIGSLMITEGGDLIQAAAFAADCGFESQAIGVNSKASVLVIGETDCNYEFRNIGQTSGPFTVPSADFTGIYLFYDSPDREEGAALITNNNGIQRAWGTDDYLLATGHTSDTLGYMDIDDLYTPIELTSAQNGYIMAIDGNGKLAWHYENESETALSFIRTVAYIDEKIYVAHHQIFKTDILVFSEEGELLDKYTWGGVTVYNITSDENDNIYISGHYDYDSGNGNISFGNEEILLPEPQSVDAFLAKYDKDLNYIWSQTITGGNIDTGVHCDVDDNGDIFLTGCIQQDGIFDKGGPDEITFTASGFEDVFLAKYSSDGRLLYANTMGGTSADIGLKVTAENTEVKLWGLFRNTIDLALDDDFSVLFTDENDELDQSYFYVTYVDFTITNTVEENPLQPSLLLYPNPVSDVLYIKHSSISGEKSTASITNMVGRSVASFNQVGSSLNVSDLQDGIYTLHLLDEKGKVTSERFLVAR